MKSKAVKGLSILFALVLAAALFTFSAFAANVEPVEADGEAVSVVPAANMRKAALSAEATTRITAQATTRVQTRPQKPMIPQTKRMK